MSRTALSYIATLHGLVRPSEYQVLQVLAQLADERQQTAQLPVATLAQYAHLSVSCARICLRRLEGRGILDTTTQMHQETGSQLPNTYRFVALAPAGPPPALAPTWDTALEHLRQQALQALQRPSIPAPEDTPLAGALLPSDLVCRVDGKKPP